MELSPYVETLREGLVTAAGAGGEDSQRIAGLLAAALEPAARLALMDALSAAAAEVTVALEDARVEVHLRGREPEIVVITGSAPDREPATEPAPEPDEQGTARVTLRLPESLKTRVENAASRQRVSVNTWLVHAVTRGLDTTPTHRSGRNLSGYARG